MSNGFRLGQERESNEKGFCRRQVDFGSRKWHRISTSAERKSDSEEIYAMEQLV
jgi:hypothetical protein